MKQVRIDVNDVLDPGDLEDGELYAVAWHDVTCEDGQNCNVRVSHARSMPMWTTGVLVEYEARALAIAQKVVQRKLREEGWDG